MGRSHRCVSSCISAEAGRQKQAMHAQMNERAQRQTFRCSCDCRWCSTSGALWNLNKAGLEAALTDANHCPARRHAPAQARRRAWPRHENTREGFIDMSMASRRSLECFFCWARTAVRPRIRKNIATTPTTSGAARTRLATGLLVAHSGGGFAAARPGNLPLECAGRPRPPQGTVKEDSIPNCDACALLAKTGGSWRPTAAGRSHSGRLRRTAAELMLASLCRPECVLVHSAGSPGVVAPEFFAHKMHFAQSQQARRDTTAEVLHDSRDCCEKGKRMTSGEGGVAKSMGKCLGGLSLRCAACHFFLLITDFCRASFFCSNQWSATLKNTVCKCKKEEKREDKA